LERLIFNPLSDPILSSLPNGFHRRLLLVPGTPAQHLFGVRRKTGAAAGD
jgi:hypothetical protein